MVTFHSIPFYSILSNSSTLSPFRHFHITNDRKIYRQICRQTITITIRNNQKVRFWLRLQRMNCSFIAIVLSYFASLSLALSAYLRLFLLSFVWMTNRNLQPVKQWSIEKETAFLMTKIIFVDTILQHYHHHHRGYGAPSLLFWLVNTDKSYLLAFHKTYNANNFRFSSFRVVATPFILFHSFVCSLFLS